MNFHCQRPQNCYHLKTMLDLNWYYLVGTALLQTNQGDFSQCCFDHFKRVQHVVHISLFRFSYIVCTTSMTCELVHNNFLIDNRASIFGAAKNFILQTPFKVLNTTGWLLLQFTLILCMQYFKS